MSSSFAGNPNNFLPETFIIPDDPEELKIKLYQYFNDISSAVNSKVSGFTVPEETITGKLFIPIFSTDRSTNASFRPIFRVAIDTGTLPSTATNTIPHGISTTENYSIISIYGGATDPGASTMTSGIPLPYINTTTPGDSVTVNIDATNINITTTTGTYTSYIRSFVIVEYIKEV